tara:strand:+ start:1363 stop:2421 length:1059 start_codon:yes stop_codon:yes gene_type:complete
MLKNLKIGKKIVNDKRCLIIAEAGVNHNGNIKNAEKLIVEAKKNGADFIKFQTYKAEKLTIKKSPRFWNWLGEKDKNGSQYDSYKRLDIFNDKEYARLSSLCKKHKIEFLSTPFDNEAVDLLLSLGVKAFKIASCDITNFPLIEKIAKTNLPIFLSTGASNLEEIKNAVKLINKFHNKICIMHCTLCYPTPDKFANLSAIKFLKDNFKNYHIGYSDHTLGIDISIASVAFGSRLIEKHFTYNKRLKKSADHWLSISPKELKKLRTSIDKVMDGIGIGTKKVLKCELKTRKLARRSLVLNKNLKKGEIISSKDLIPKRPGVGISPSEIKKILGKKLRVNKYHDEVLFYKDLKK